MYPNHDYLGLLTVLCHILCQEFEYDLKMEPVISVQCAVPGSLALTPSVCAN